LPLARKGSTFCVQVAQSWLNVRWPFFLLLSGVM
jgi:hypothetical protein